MLVGRDAHHRFREPLNSPRREYDPGNTRDLQRMVEHLYLALLDAGSKFFADGLVDFIDDPVVWCLCDVDPADCVRCYIRERLGLPEDRSTSE